jgi:hypothetical protein
MIQISGDTPRFSDEKLRTRIIRRIFRIKDILVGSPYKINVTLKNIGTQIFNGGVLTVSGQWATNQSTFTGYPINSLAPNESVKVVFQHGAMNKYYGLIFATLIDKTGQNIPLYNEAKVPYQSNQCFSSVWAIDMEELLTRYALMTSAISLVVLVLTEVLIPIIIWLR